MTAAEFVAQLDEANQAVLRRLEPEATLKPEVTGTLNVTNLLKVALKNEIEATEIAARWLVATTDVEVKMAFARQAGDEAKHYRMIAERLGELGFDARSFDPLAQGFGPLFKYLDSLETTVERVAAGQFTREAIAVVKNRQFIEFCDRAGDRLTATLYREIIEPDERFHHQLGRSLLLKLATTPGDAGGGAAGVRAHAGARGRAAGRGAPDRRHPPRARLLMDADPSLAAFAVAVDRPDDQIHLARAALLIAAGEQPDLDVDDVPRAPRRAGGGRRAGPARRRRPRPSPPAPRIPLRGAGLLGGPRGLLRPAQQPPQRSPESPPRHPDHAVARAHRGRAAVSISRWRASGCPGTSSPAPASRASRCCSIPSTAARC